MQINVGVVERVMFWDIVARRWDFRGIPGDASWVDAVEGLAVGLRGQVEKVRKAGERRLGKLGDIILRGSVMGGKCYGRE